MSYCLVTKFNNYKNIVHKSYGNKDYHKLEELCLDKDCCNDKNIKYGINFKSFYYAEEFLSLINNKCFYYENRNREFEIIKI